MAKKVRKSFRVAPDVSAMLEDLALKFGVTETVIAEMAIRKFHKEPELTPRDDTPAPPSAS